MGIYGDRKRKGGKENDVIIISKLENLLKYLTNCKSLFHYKSINVEKFIFEEIKGTMQRKASSVLKAFTLILTHTRMQTHIQTHTHTDSLYTHTHILLTYNIHTNTYRHTYKYTHTYTNIHAHTYTWLTSPDFLLVS